jgi:hypothetical protein
MTLSRSMIFQYARERRGIRAGHPHTPRSTDLIRDDHIPDLAPVQQSPAEAQHEQGLSRVAQQTRHSRTRTAGTHTRLQHPCRGLAAGDREGLQAQRRRDQQSAHAASAPSASFAAV